MDYVKSTLAQNFGGETHKLAPKDQQFELEDVPDLTGKVAVVTGGSEGIGYACSHTLLAHNISKLFIISKSQEVMDGALNAIKEEMGASTAEKVNWIQCDLTDWPAVTAAASKISKSTDRLDILIEDAARGIMTYQLTKYGVDEHMALNHIGHVVLTSHLLPLLKKTGSNGNTVRIVTFGSNLHQSAPSSTKFASLDELNTDLGPNTQYARSKLATILYARYLAHNLSAAYPNILVNAIHPGIVETAQSTKHIHEAYPVGGFGMSVGLNPFKKDQFMGAVSAMFAATKTTKTGEYICPPATPEKGSSMSNDVELGEQLMKLTREVVKEKTFDESAAKGCPFEFS